jgi:CRP-like cAMP-binding protein
MTNGFSYKSQGSVENRLLADLPDEVLNRLLPHLQPVSFALGDIVYESSEQMEHLYFPTTCIVSLLYTMNDGATAEMGLVGNDGVVGIALFMGGNTVPNRAVVQVAGAAFRVGIVGNEGMVGIPVFLGAAASLNRALVQGAGTALKMKADAMRKHIGHEGLLPDMLRHYTYSLLAQISQTAACNRFHTVEVRLARWLLLTHDRLQSNEFRLTQQFLSDMLGVRREGVTNAARALQRERLISYVRGQITILNRAGLEAASCKCYEIVKLDGLAKTAKKRKRYR